MHNAQLDENSILKQIFKQWDHTIVESLIDRMATEAGIPHNFSFVASEMEITPEATDTRNPKKGVNKKKHFNR